MKGQKGDGLDLGKRSELNNVVPSQHLSASIFLPFLSGHLPVPGTVLDVAATPGTTLSKIPTVLGFLDRWRADIKNSRLIRKDTLLSYVKCYEGKAQELRPQMLHLIEMGKAQQSLSEYSNDI